MQDVQGFADGGMRHGDRHEQKRAFIKTGHELPPQTREFLCQIGDRGGILDKTGEIAVNGGETNPGNHTPGQDEGRQYQKEPFVLETPPKQSAVVVLNQEKESHQPAHEGSHEHEIDQQAFFGTERQPMARQHQRHRGSRQEIGYRTQPPLRPSPRQINHQSPQTDEGDDHSEVGIDQESKHHPQVDQ